MADPTGKHAEFAFNDGSGRTFSAAAIGAANQIVLTVNGAPIVQGATVTASYTLGTVLATDGGILASFAGQAVTNNSTVDAGTPFVQAATVNGTSLVLTYNEALDETSVPATTDFAVANSGVAQSVTNVAVNGSAVTLTLAPGVFQPDTVTIDYTAGGAPIRDLATNNAAALNDQAVTNNTPAGAAPVVTAAAVAANGTTITLTFDKNMPVPTGKHAAQVPIWTLPVSRQARSRLARSSVENG